MSAGRQRKQPLVQIYALTCPVSGHVRYVGKADDAKTRFSGHLSIRNAKDTPLYRWIRSLSTTGAKPGLMILETVEQDLWQERETAWISHYRAVGNLLNRASGGNQPDRSFMNDSERHMYELTRDMGTDLARARKRDDLASKRLYAKLLLNCMVLYDLHPLRMPPKWRKLRWDEDKLGPLTWEVMKQFVAPKLFSRLTAA